MKYWNKARIQSAKERHNRASEKKVVESLERTRKERSYAHGKSAKNSALMLEILGSSINRKMLARLRDHGAVSVTFLIEPFNLTLPAGVVRVNALERVGLITTKKQGRIRFCIYNPVALEELAHHLAFSSNPFSQK